MPQRNQWVSEAHRRALLQAERDYTEATREAREYLKTQHSSETLRALLTRYNSQVGPVALAWRDALQWAIPRAEENERREERILGQMEMLRHALTERRALYDLRGFRISADKRGEIYDAHAAQVEEEAREWESYDSNPYEPGEGDMEDPYYDERNAELLAPLET